MNDNSVKKDICIAATAILLFYIILVGANVIDNKFGLSQVFNLVDIAAAAMKVATASALAWLVKKLVFAKTLGRDFGAKFDSGWYAMNDTEKARWIIGTFLVLFGVISILL